MWFITSCMLAYENFIGGKLTDPETIEEDFNQVDPDDMEDMDIQWNMAMIFRREKRFLNRTGRKFIGGHSNAKVGFDKSKAKCYECNNFGHFARECQKDKAPASRFTRPSQGNNQGYNNSNNRNQGQGGTSNALVAQQDDNFDWGVHLEDALIAQTQVGLMTEIMEMMEAEEREASVADQEESTPSWLLERHHLKGNIEKLKNSRFVGEHYESVVRQVNGLGLGTNAIPPPVSGKFVNGLIDIDLSCLDESSSRDDSSNQDDSSSKADSASDEEFLTASDDGSKNICPEGVVSEELLGEQKVKKNIITDSDNCILTEPDIVESNEKLKLMRYGGYKNINQVKKEAFSANYGLGYQENMQKYYIPKNQSSSGQTTVHQTTVHQTTSPAHHAESSNVRSNEPYRRTYKEKRTCFHCGMVSHILVNFPAKNQGKRPIVSQPAVISNSPPVKHSKSPIENVVKPPVKPMVKPKITSEAKPYVPKRENLSAKPCASTSGSAPTGEKPVVKLSKPQRRRMNKRLRKLEQLAGIQPGEASTSSPSASECKATVPVKQKKRSWNKKSKSSQSPGPKSSKDSSIFYGHDCELIEVVYFDKDGRPKTTMAWVSKSN
ncbi:hypothetical protein L1987_27824 [Smallanthus sonchifolius]|uniref:Uncharacterized protein n=1 Tax=Smallanthus sonchifolius TaxID=185202 RepID=A0ACB9IBQ1_9ASTR|nr:hypothetical protein L1987_27824 [Smallanthus sonchifolius]